MDLGLLLDVLLVWGVFIGLEYEVLDVLFDVECRVCCLLLLV